MKVYDSYAEAKIANPESDIYERMCVDFATADYVSLVAMCGTGEGWNKCDPADHCMTVDQFIAEGHRFANGDICLMMAMWLQSNVGLIGMSHPLVTMNAMSYEQQH